MLIGPRAGPWTADAAGGAIAVTEVTADDAEYVVRVRATDPSGAYSNVNVTINRSRTRTKRRRLQRRVRIRGRP